MSISEHNALMGVKNIKRLTLFKHAAVHKKAHRLPSRQINYNRDSVIADFRNGMMKAVVMNKHCISESVFNQLMSNALRRGELSNQQFPLSNFQNAEYFFFKHIAIGYSREWWIVKLANFQITDEEIQQIINSKKEQFEDGR